MSTVRFEVLGAPQGKGRPKASARGGFVRMYTPAKTVSYEALIGHAAHAAMRGEPLLDCPVSVDMDIRCPIPASWSQKRQRQALAGEIWPTTKPDVDNVEKVVFDAINGVVWRDDVVVVRVSKLKRYASTPGITVTIEPVQATAPIDVVVQPALDLEVPAVKVAGLAFQKTNADFFGA